ncbi:MAG: tetratricopeptide repeat protein [Nitrospirota bacterium]
MARYREKRDGYQIYLSLFLVISIPLILYINFLHAPFQYDDIHQITGNPYIKDIRNIPRFFKESRTTSLEEKQSKAYRPLLTTTFAINYYFGRLDPYGYHLVNLILHIITSLLLYLIVWKMTNEKMTALFSSLIFAAHPFNTEVINYITARSSLLSTMFYFASFLSFIIYRKISGSITLLFFSYLIFLISFIFSFLTKEMAVTLPVMLILYDGFFRMRENNRVCMENSPFSKGGFRGIFGLYIKPVSPYLPIIIGTLIYLMLRKGVIGGRIIITPRYEIFESIILILQIIYRYILLFLFPFDLNIGYEIVVSSSILEISFISLLILSVFVCSIFIYKYSRVVSFFILWSYITIAPFLVLPFITRSALFQENRAYIACAAFAVVAGSLINYLGKERRGYAYVLLFAALISFYSIRVIKRNIIWEDSLTLWSVAVKRSPLSYLAYRGLGAAYYEQDEIESAIQAFRNSLFLKPNYVEVYYHLGMAYYKKDDIENAIEMYKKAIIMKPNYYDAHNNLGLIYKEKGMIEKAINEFTSAISADPYKPSAYINLGTAYGLKGLSDMAIKEYKNALKINQNNPNTHFNLGLAYRIIEKDGSAFREYKEAVRLGLQSKLLYFELGKLYQRHRKLREAIKEYRTAITIDPDYYDAHNNLGVSYELLGKYDKAFKEYKEAVRINPNSAVAHNNIGIIYQMQGEFDSAINKFQIALQLRSGYIDAQYNLAHTYALIQNKQEAVKQYNKVLKLASGRQKLRVYIDRTIDDLKGFGLASISKKLMKNKKKSDYINNP